MKIIAIEEHTVNSAIGAAVADVVKDNVPYIATFANPELTGSAPAGALTDLETLLYRVHCLLQRSQLPLLWQSSPYALLLL